MGELSDHMNRKMDAELGLGDRVTIQDVEHSPHGTTWVTIDGKEEPLPDHVYPDKGLRAGQKVYVKRKEGKISGLKD